MIISRLMVAFGLLLSFAGNSGADPFSEPWKDDRRAIIIDAYAHNEIDLTKIVTDQRVTAFIHKGSDGLPPPYACSGNETERDLCRSKWRRYIIAKELYHTRRHLAKALGLKWGVYHLARPGNPIEQARHFLSYAQPADDEVMVIDLEGLSDKWMSLEDTERFAWYIKNRTGRWPMLYTNGATSRHIADRKDEFPVLSRLPLWYARYKPEIDDHFPKGHWTTYQIWQFVSQINCGKSSCPYRVPGTNTDIDVNIVDMSADELRAAWPFDTLVNPVPDDQEEPGPTDRELMMVEAPLIFPHVTEAVVTGDDFFHHIVVSALGQRPNIDPLKTYSVSNALPAQPVNDLF